MTRLLHNYAYINGELADVSLVWHYMEGVHIDSIYDRDTGERFEMEAVNPDCIRRITKLIEERYCNN